MAFVNEDIPEEDKKKYGTKPGNPRWTIDRGRDAVLVYTDAYGMGETYLFDLYWGAIKLEIKTARETAANKNNARKQDVVYTVRQIRVLGSSAKNIDEINSITTEALETYGFVGNKEITGDVLVHAPQKSKIYFVDNGHSSARG